MTRYLAIDCGSKRIGLAISDGQNSIVSPVATVAATGRIESDVRAVLQAINDYQVDEFVVGLPLNMDDSEGPQAKLSRRFGAVLQEESKKPVYFHDERLTSIAADELLRDRALTRKKKRARQDQLAALVLLQSFLESRQDANGHPPNAPPRE